MQYVSFCVPSSSMFFIGWSSLSVVHRHQPPTKHRGMIHVRIDLDFFHWERQGLTLPLYLILSLFIHFLSLKRPIKPSIESHLFIWLIHVDPRQGGPDLFQYFRQLVGPTMKSIVFFPYN